MKNSMWKRAIAACLTVVVVMILVVSGKSLTKKEHVSTHKEEKSYSGNVAASALNVSVDFYDYNIKTYKGKEVDKNTKIALNAYALEKITSGTSITADQVFLFGGDRRKGETGAQNVWTGYGKSQYQGIVKKQLDANGNLQFNDAAGIYGVNMFPAQGDHSVDTVVDSYYNANFQFLDENGTYIYDSAKFAAYNLKKVNETESTLTIDTTKAGPYFSKGTGTFQNHYGFFPFNTVEEGTINAEEARHHMFGMKMELDFYMPEDGRIVTEDETREEDMVFKFCGDDDVWVFIDGNLALDLGGIHDTVGGEINFATGDVTYEKVAAGGIKTDVKNIYDAYPEIKKDAFSEHTLTMFYLERGEYDSNCKITFNIPTILINDDISITKKVADAPEDNNDTYDFTLYTGQDKDNLTDVYTGKYKVYDKENVFIGERRATSGVITLKADETAVIKRTNVALGQYYMVKENADADRYTTSWFSTGDDSNASSGMGTQTDVLVRNQEHPKGSHIEFTNKYRTFTSLSLKKLVDAAGYDGEAFTFVVTIGEETYDVTLKDGEERIFNHIPKGTAYKIVEVLTPGAIYTTPDAQVDGQLVDVKKETVSGYAISGVMKEDMEEGFVTKVVYTNHGEKETATPNVTATPDTTPSNTPNSIVTNAPTETPKPTDTPVVTEAPTDTPKVTETPIVTAEPTKEPTEEPTVTATPVDTENPANTPEVTETPSVSQVPTEAPEIDIPEETKVPGAPPLPQETIVEETKAPEDIIPDEDVPANPVHTATAAPTKKPTTSNRNQDTPDDETIVVDEVPSQLPQTGGIGKLMQEHKAATIWILLLPIVSIVGIAYIVERRKETEKK